MAEEKIFSITDDNNITAENDLTVKGDLSVEGTITGPTIDMLIPIGSILPFSKSFPNAPALSPQFVECDGSEISDSESVFNGYRSYNLNGADVELTLDWTAGDGPNGGSTAIVIATDLTALAVGDAVSGVTTDGDIIEITEGAYITDITDTTIEISDADVSGSITTTFTNDGEFIRGGMISGVGQKDAFQGHRYASPWYQSPDQSQLHCDNTIWGSEDIENKSKTVPQSAANFSDRYRPFTGDPKSDGTNGEPRTASETRPINRLMVYIMRIK